MAVERLENMTALAAHHMPGMDVLHKRVLLLRNDGKSDAEAAIIEGVSEATIRIRLSVASSEIAMCLPDRKRLNGEMRGGWTQGHLECCLADAVAELRGVAR